MHIGCRQYNEIIMIHCAKLICIPNDVRYSRSCPCDIPKITISSKSQEILLVTQCEPTLRIEWMCYKHEQTTIGYLGRSTWMSVRPFVLWGCGQSGRCLRATLKGMSNQCIRFAYITVGSGDNHGFFKNFWNCMGHHPHVFWTRTQCAWWLLHFLKVKIITRP